jgi:hypothetical protein
VAGEDGKPRPLHITAVGADSVGKQELALDLVARADFLVCDLEAQSRERGEFQHFLGREEPREGGAGETGERPARKPLVSELGALLVAADSSGATRRGLGLVGHHVAPDGFSIFDTSGWTPAAGLV